MTIALIYICVTHGPITADLAARFVATYLLFPPGIEHRVIIACNGGPLSLDRAALFLPLNCEFIPRVNDQGFDISAYQEIARKTDAEFLVCCGESVFFHRPGWLLRLAMVRERFGPGMYGVYSSFLVRPHLNTTMFAADTRLLRNYPRVLDKRGRYNFEHGENSFWRFVAQRGGAAKFVTWDGVYDPAQWRTPQNILWRGDQSNLLAFCNHTERFDAAPPETQLNWSRGADSLRSRETLRWPMQGRQPVMR